MLAKIRVVDTGTEYQITYEMTLTNVGRGPAINCLLRVQDASHPKSMGIVREGYRISVLPADREMPVGCSGTVATLAAPDFTRKLDHVFEVAYEDIARDKHETVMLFESTPPTWTAADPALCSWRT